MQIKHTIVTLLTFLLLGTSVPATTADIMDSVSRNGLEDSYPLFCRKGGNMKMRINKGIVTGDRKPTLNIYIRFDRNPVKFDYAKQSLKPGMCAYKTRPLLDNEPNQMRMTTASEFGVEFALGGTASPKFTYESSVVQNKFKDVARFINTLNNEEYFTVDVAKTKNKGNKGHRNYGFVITRLH